MNRLIVCIILLIGSTPALAEKLYRWIEADGSITFSPNPPPKGIEFKTVDSGANNAAMPEMTPGAQKSNAIMATSEHALPTQPLQQNQTTVTTRPAPALPKQRLSYAPEIGNNNNAQPLLAQTAQQNPAPVTQNNAVASNKKRKQCQDLSKRVISLERRLRSPLAPNDMDNTVIAMARYQKSFDQYCVN